MNIVDSIAYAKSEIERCTERLALLEIITPIFEGVELPKDISLTVQRFSSGEIFVDVYPGYQAGVNKDIKSIAHQIARKFHVKVHKQKGYDEQSIDYKAKFSIPNSDGTEQKYIIEVSGVVPKNCRIEVEQEMLTQEELEAAKKAALESVKPFRETRKIVCK